MLATKAEETHKAEAVSYLLVRLLPVVLEEHVDDDVACWGRRTELGTGRAVQTQGKAVNVDVPRTVVTQVRALQPAIREAADLPGLPGERCRPLVERLRGDRVFSHRESAAGGCISQPASQPTSSSSGGGSSGSRSSSKEQSSSRGRGSSKNKAAAGAAAAAARQRNHEPQSGTDMCTTPGRRSSSAGYRGVHNAGNSGKEVASRANLYERDFELLWVIARVAEDLPQFKGID